MKVVVTGIGIISPIGIGVETFWENAINGKSGIRRITECEISRCRSQIAGFCDEFREDDFFTKKDMLYLSKASKFSLAAVQLCMKDSNIDVNSARDHDFGCYWGTSQSGMLELEKYFYDYWLGDKTKRDILILPKIMESSMAANIAIKYKLKGPNITINTACSSSTNSIGYAYRAIKSGEISAAFAGGVNILSPTEIFFDAWNNMRILSFYNDSPQCACRPFAKSRNGTVISEGSAVLLLEESSEAIKRNARIYAEIVGYTSNCDADNLVSPNQKSLENVLRSTLKSACVNPSDIDYINSHGTGTQLNDLIETNAIKNVFKEKSYSIPINSTKSLIGHAMGGSGAIEAAVVCLSISAGIIHPTINYIDRDPLCDLDYVPNNFIRKEIKYAISNSFGMGGNNAVLVFKRYDNN